MKIALLPLLTVAALCSQQGFAQSLKWLGHLRGAPSHEDQAWSSFSRGITDEGQVVGDFVAFQNIFGGPTYTDNAFSWKDGVFVELPFTRANWISPDGRTILGEIDERDAQGGFVATGPVQWKLNDMDEVEVTTSIDGPLIKLNDEISVFLQANGKWGDVDSFDGYVVHDVSADHRVYVGSKYFPNQTPDVLAVIWTANTETILPSLPGAMRMDAFAVSDDGSTVVGQAFFGGPQDREIMAFIWDEFDGTRTLEEVGAESIPDWEDIWDLDSANAISPDGVYVTGDGCLDGENEEPWIMELPPTVKVRIRLPEDSPEVGAVIPVQILVRSTLPEAVRVSFPKKLLQTEDTEILEFERISVEPFTLTLQEPTKLFEVDVEIKSYGVAELSTEIEFTEEGKKKTKKATAEVFIPSLKVSLSALPLIDGKPIVDFELDEDMNPTDRDGNAVTPKIEVVIENLSHQPVTAVFQGLDPRARDDSGVLGRIKTLGTFPIELGKVIKGTPVIREIDLKLNEDGRFEFAALLTGYFDDPTNQFNVAKRGAPIAVGEPYPVEVEMEFVRTATITNQAPETFFVSPGGGIKIIAAVNNTTTNKTLHFKGIDAEKRKNAFGSLLTSIEGNATEPPIEHDHEVDANSAVILSGFIETDAFGAPTGTVKWIMPEDAHLIDNKTEERTDLTADDWLVTTEIDGWLDDDNSLTIIQDNSRPLPAQLTNLESAGLIAGNFTKATLIAMAKWTDDSFDAIGGIGRVAGRISADPSLLSDALGDGARFVWESAELVHLGWTSMTPAEKDAFIQQAVIETIDRAQFLLEAPFDVESYPAALAYTQNAVAPLFTGVSEAYATDDPARIAQLYGTISGNIAMEVATAFLPDPKFTRYVDGAELANLAKAADNIRSLNQQQKILQAVPAGPIGRRLAIDGWGIGGKHLDDVQDALRRLKMKGYARERAPKSITLSEVWDEAVLKPQAMKPKGFSDLDQLMLGDDIPTIKGKNGADLDLDAITVVMWPPENKVIRSNLILKGESDDVIDAVLSRADARRKEYKKRFPEFKQYKDEGIPIEFDYKSNDTLPTKPNNPKGAKRNFDFDTIETSGGAIIHVPKMGNAKNELRYITGDVDWIHFSWLDGTPLDSKTASKLYELLETCCGLQHGETVTWINKGQAVFEGKASQIGEYLTGPNQKALLEVTGDSIRAVRIRPELTRFAKDARNHLIFFDGGTKSLQKALKTADLENIFAQLFSVVPSRKVILPFMWFAKSANFGEDPTIDGQEWSYSDDPDAIMARQANDGSLERFDGREWLPWDPKADPNPGATPSAFQGLAPFSGIAADGVLQLTPASTLAEGTLAGQSNLPILDLASLWADELGDRLASWFAIGDTIIIAPGTPVQELRRIVSLAPLTLDRPLSYDHFEDTLVAVLPDGLLPQIETVVATTLLNAAPLIVDDAVAYGFNLPYGAQSVFETSVDLKNWTPIDADALIGGSLIDGAVQSLYPTEPIFILLTPTDPSNPSRFLRWRDTLGDGQGAKIQIREVLPSRSG